MIYINDTALSAMPNELTEITRTISSTQESINGNKQQVVVGSAKSVTMVWQWAKPALVKYFEQLSASGDPLTYRNDASEKYGTFEFPGIITVDPGSYIRGGTGLTPLTVTIEEGDNH